MRVVASLMRGVCLACREGRLTAEQRDVILAVCRKELLACGDDLIANAVERVLGETKAPTTGSMRVTAATGIALAAAAAGVAIGVAAGRKAR